jgi:2'-5' RNA ligase
VRLFVAVNLPDAVRRAIWETAAPLRESGLPVRWVASDGVHLTIKFLGEVADRREPEIVQGLTHAAEGARRFTLPIAGFGAFPTPTRPRVVWVGCEAVPPLELLQHRVEREMETLGFPIEGRPFRPHITLGRVSRDGRPSDFSDFPRALEALRYAGEATVESLDLMQSTLAPAGARYARRHGIVLG